MARSRPLKSAEEIELNAGPGLPGLCYFCRSQFPRITYLKQALNAY